jgi:hypothetical protein
MAGGLHVHGRDRAIVGEATRTDPPSTYRTANSSLAPASSATPRDRPSLSQK